MPGAMKAVFRYQQDTARLAFVREHLSSDWEIVNLPEPDSPQQVREAVFDAHMLLSMSFDASYTPAPRLKLLQLPGAGLDRVEFEAVPASATVCNVYEHEVGIAEYLVAVMLEWEIGVRAMHDNMRQGRWRGSFVDRAPLHGELAGKTVGFLGYGRIARETAKRLRAFGVRIVALTRTSASIDDQVDVAYATDGLLTMMQGCDFAIVSCPLTETTRGLVGERALNALGRSGVIINVGRGPIVDEDALFAALQSRRIGGAIIDTWYQYPMNGEAQAFPSRYPIHKLDNVIMTPHASGWSAGLMDRRWRVIIDNMNRLARGDSLRNAISGAR